MSYETQQIQHATYDDVSQIYELMQLSVSRLPSRDWFMDDDSSFIERHIAQEGYTLKMMDGDDMAGFLIVRHPGLQEDNLGRYLSLPEEELLLCSHMESTSVHPRFQGQHILSRLIDHAAAIEKETFHQKYLLATVHPDNRYSKNSLIRCGFTAHQTFPKYNGWLRTLMVRQLSSISNSTLEPSPMGSSSGSH